MRSPRRLGSSEIEAVVNPGAGRWVTSSGAAPSRRELRGQPLAATRHWCPRPIPFGHSGGGYQARHTHARPGRSPGRVYAWLTRGATGLEGRGLSAGPSYRGLVGLTIPGWTAGVGLGGACGAKGRLAHPSRRLASALRASSRHVEARPLDDYP